MIEKNRKTLIRRGNGAVIGWVTVKDGIITGHYHGEEQTFPTEHKAANWVDQQHMEAAKDLDRIYQKLKGAPNADPRLSSSQEGETSGNYILQRENI
jgi:hypothetical protein